MSGVTLSQAISISLVSQNYPSTSLIPNYSSPDFSQNDDVYARAGRVLDNVLFVLQVIGLVLNVINIIVMTRRSMRSPTTTFLVALSGLQLLYITVSGIRVFSRLFSPFQYTDAFFVIYDIYLDIYGLTCLRRSMYCIQCCVSVERLLAVWLPLKAKQFLLVRRPWLFILATPVVVFLTHIYLTLKLEVIQITDTPNQTFYSFGYTRHYRHHSEIFDNLSITMKVIFVYLTLVMLITTNLAMTGVIKRYASMRRQMKTNVDVDAAQKRETQMTVTILVSTLIFVVLCLPTVTFGLAIDIAPKTSTSFISQPFLILFTQKIGGLLFTLAFSTDFFTYVALSSTYRKTLLRLFKKEGGSVVFNEN